MEHIPESAKKHLEKAEQFLSDARAFLPENRLDSSVDRAYYSMFHGANAILLANGYRPPKTHKGTIHLFYQNIVNRDIVPKSLGKDLARMLEARQDATYSVDSDLSAEETGKIIDHASLFLQGIKKALGRI